VSARDPLHEVVPGDRWLVTVAHPDDETFGCGSLIAYAAHAGAEVTVLCATRGEEGERTPDIATDADLGAVRTEELHTAAAILGVHEVLLLEHRDSGFDGPMPPGALGDVPLDALAPSIRSVIERVAPTVVVTLDASDGHRDHECIRTATHAALARLDGAPPAVVAEVALSNRLMRRWAAEMAEGGDADSPYLRIDLDVLGTPDERITDVLDLAELLDVRERAIAAHASQRSPFEDLSPELRRAFLADTSLIRVAR
jgi:LmbE family N-acetylglucosaminyl deacetylase